MVKKYLIEVWSLKGEIVYTRFCKEMVDKWVQDHSTIALFLIREKTPSEKAEWGSRVKELTNQ